jgi:hypothetical protein
MRPTSSHSAQPWARVRPEHHRSYPVGHHGRWFRVVQRYDPGVPQAGYDVAQAPDGEEPFTLEGMITAVNEELGRE